MQPCIIISSMPLSRAMLRYVPPGAYIIAADAGWQRAQTLGLQPNLVLGDFDSAPPPQAPGLECLHLPAQKNDTDTHFAARQAVLRGFKQVSLLGGTGGRLDHTLANLQTLHFLAQSGVQNLLADEDTEIRCMLPGRLVLPANPGFYLSVFAVGGPAQGVTLQGVKYPLDAATLTCTFPLGTSNEFAAPQAAITLQQGALLVVLSRKN